MCNRKANRASQAIRDDAGFSAGQDFPNGCTAVIDHEYASFFGDRHAGSGRCERLASLDAGTVRANDRDAATNIGNDIAAVRRLYRANRCSQTFDNWLQPSIRGHDENLIGAAIGDQQSPGVVEADAGRCRKAGYIDAARTIRREAVDLVAGIGGDIDRESAPIANPEGPARPSVNVERTPAGSIRETRPAPHSAT